MRGRLLGLAALLGLLAPLAACGGTDERPSIVVTTNILGDIVTEITGDAAEILVLMPPGGDPHSFGISAQQAAAMEQAELIIANGLGLEEGLESHLAQAEESGVEVLAIGEHLDPLVYDAGTSAGTPDPHVWTDPGRMLAAVEILSEEIVELTGDPVAVESSAGAYADRLRDADAEVAELLGSVPAERRALITNHQVFGYLADRFDYRVIGAIVPSGTTLASPSAADLEALAGAIRDEGVPAIFADSSQPTRLAEVLAAEADLEVAVVPLHTESLSEPGGEAGTYLDMIRVNAERISTGLSG